jgi:hypothetical protein
MNAAPEPGVTSLEFEVRRAAPGDPVTWAARWNAGFWTGKDSHLIRHQRMDEVEPGELAGLITRWGAYEATVLIRTARGYIGQWEQELAATAPEMAKPGVAEHMVWELAVSAMTGVIHGALPRLAARMPRDPPGWERAALIVASYGHEVSWCLQDLADLDDPDADEVHVHNYLVLTPLERDVTVSPAPVSVVDEVAAWLRVVPRVPRAVPASPHGGRTVWCEACGVDWTDSPDTGGFMYDDHPVGPCCARRLVGLC